ncbi:MAG: ArnT family glycosyltransferase [Acidobacteriota bacterium]
MNDRDRDPRGPRVEGPPRRSNAERLIGLTVGVSGGLVAGLAWLMPSLYRALPLHAGDSPTYLEWDPRRPPLYPLVLSAVRLVDPDSSVLGACQLVIFVAAAAWLAVTVGRTTRQPWLAATAGVAVVCHPQVISYCFTILPESLLAALMMGHAAALIRLVERPATSTAVLAGATLAAAVLCKPAAVGFAGGVLLLVPALWHHRHRVRWFGAVAAAVAVPLLGVSLVNAGRTGVFAPQAMGGHAMLGVVGTFMPDDTPIEPPALQQALVRGLTPIRSELSRIDSITWYYFYSSHAYHYAVEGATRAVLDYREMPAAAAATDEVFLEMNDLGAMLTPLVVARAPRAYARHVVAHLYGLWMMPLIRRASDEDRFRHEQARMQATYPVVGRDPIAQRTVPDALFWPYQAFLLIGLAGSVGAILVFLRHPRRRRWLVPAMMGAMVHGYFLLTAAAQTGLPRYALTAWPLQAMLVWGVIGAMLSYTSFPGHPTGPAEGRGHDE